MGLIMSVYGKNIKERVPLIAGRILKLGLKKDDFLPLEAELCKYIGVSRTTLRESILVMEYLGYVTGGHGKPRKIAKCLTGLIS